MKSKSDMVQHSAIHFMMTSDQKKVNTLRSR